LMMLTAKKDPESEIKGIDLGADDYMGKPFDGSRLVARVRMLLRRQPTA
jgi:two-component system phosphate regulon response regulator OmpR